MEFDDTDELTHTECVGIVNWIYRIMKNADERVAFTLELFSRIKELNNVERYITYSNGVFYNKAKIEIHFFSSISGVSNFVSSIK